MNVPHQFIVMLCARGVLPCQAFPCTPPRVLNVYNTYTVGGQNVQAEHIPREQDTRQIK